MNEYICLATVMYEVTVTADNAVEADEKFRAMSVRDIIQQGGIQDVDRDPTGELPQEA